MTETLAGRHVDGAPFTGLVERLSRIAVIAHVVEAQPDAFTRDALLEQFAVVATNVAEALAFSGATLDEANAMFSAVLNA